MAGQTAGVLRHQLSAVEDTHLGGAQMNLEPPAGQHQRHRVLVGIHMHVPPAGGFGEEHLLDRERIPGQGQQDSLFAQLNSIANFRVAIPDAPPQDQTWGAAPEGHCSISHP